MPAPDEWMNGWQKDEREQAQGMLWDLLLLLTRGEPPYACEMNRRKIGVVHRMGSCG